MDNRTLLEKALGAFESGTFFDGGKLNPEQQAAFMVILKKQSKLLQMIDLIPMKRPVMEISKLHISAPISRGVAENTNPGFVARGKTNSVKLSVKKMISAWDLTTESLQNNIEQENFEDTIMKEMTNQIANDLELLAIQGDTSLSVNTDELSALLSILDGWDKKSESAHIYDASGETISKNIFHRALREMPQQYRNDPNLMFLCSEEIYNDWLNLLAERGTGGGDAALSGQGIKPFGRMLMPIPMIPSNKALSLKEGLPAEAIGNVIGPFEFTSGVNDTLILNINGAGNFNVVFGSGVLDTVIVANILQAAFTANAAPARAYDDGEGRIVIRTTAVGAAQTIAIQVGSTAASVLGLEGAGLPNNKAGVNAGTAGNLAEGSFIWLVNPKNLVMGMLQDTRIYSEFNKDFDRFETVAYNQIDVAVANIDALVKVKNLRKQSA